MRVVGTYIRRQPAFKDGDRGLLPWDVTRRKKARTKKYARDDGTDVGRIVVGNEMNSRFLFSLPKRQDAHLDRNLSFFSRSKCKMEFTKRYSDFSRSPKI